MIYLDHATATHSVSFSPPFGERMSSYGARHGLEKLFWEKDLRLRSLFLLGSEDEYHITSSWDEIPRSIVRSCGKKRIGVSFSDTKAALRACDEARKISDVIYMREEERLEDALLFLQYVHPLTGVVTPLEKLEVAKKRNCLIALDISYALGKVPLGGVLERADYLLVRGAALGAPFNLSLVAARGQALERKDVELDALSAFVECVEQAVSQEMFFATEVARLKSLFEEGEEVLFQEEGRAPHISCIKFRGIKNELLLFTLAQRNLFATMGGGPFPLLDRMMDPVDGMSALSFCLGRDITEKDVREAKVRLKRAVKELHVISEGLL